MQAEPFGTPHALGIAVKTHDQFTREYWHDADRTCSLAWVSGSLEVRLADQSGLVAVWPCTDYVEALTLASEWKLVPPNWWPPFLDEQAGA